MFQAKLKVLQGNKDKITLVYGKFVKQVFGYAYYLTSRKEMAEDLTAQTFLKAWENLDDFKGDLDQIKAWLFRILRNLWIDHYRRRKAEVILEESNELQIEPNFDHVVLVEEVYRQIRKLRPTIYGEVLMLKYKFDFEDSEIGRIYNKAEANIRKIRSRALLKLKQQMQ